MTDLEKINKFYKLKCRFVKHLNRFKYLKKFLSFVFNNFIFYSFAHTISLIEELFFLEICPQVKKSNLYEIF